MLQIKHKKEKEAVQRKVRERQDAEEAELERQYYARGPDLRRPVVVASQHSTDMASPSTTEGQSWSLVIVS